MSARVIYISLLLYLIISYLQAYRFKGNKLFYYFFVAALWYPILVLLRKLIIVDYYVYMSITSLVFMWCFPVKLYVFKIVLSFITLMMLLRFEANFWVVAVLTELADIFSMFAVLKFIKEEIRSGDRISLFLIIVIVDLLLSAINTFFYFHAANIHLIWFLPSAILNNIIYVVNVIYGPKKKIAMPSLIRKFLVVKNAESNGFVAENKNSISALQIDPIIEPLTKREKEILELIKQGYTNKEIAEKENVAVTTIESHLQNIKEKLGFKKMQGLRKYIKNLP